MSITDSPTSELTVTQAGNGTVVVRLAGSWQLESGLPSLTELEQALEAFTLKYVDELIASNETVRTFLAK